jgi:nucleotide-binding universal stress UspA family protein
MSKYLVPLDGSEAGEAAIPWAKYLSEKTGNGIELLRCFRSLAAVYSYPDFATPPPVPYDLSGFARVSEKYLNMCVRDYQLEKADVVVKEGEPAETIVQQSLADEVEAILMTSHGGGGFGRWLLGSVVTKVVRASRKPVYVFRSDAEKNKSPSLKKILVCLDGSKLSERALIPASKLAKLFQSEIVLYQAVEYTPYPVAAFEMALENQRETSVKYLQDVKSRYPDLDLSIEVQTISSADGIVGMSKDCDLVVLSSHGHGGFERWLLGSTTEKVLHRSSAPILVVYDTPKDGEG